jgi:hypothetical protein
VIPLHLNPVGEFMVPLIKGLLHGFVREEADLTQFGFSGRYVRHRPTRLCSFVCQPGQKGGGSVAAYTPRVMTVALQKFDAVVFLAEVGSALEDLEMEFGVLLLLHLHSLTVQEANPVPKGLSVATAFGHTLELSLQPPDLLIDLDAPLAR